MLLTEKSMQIKEHPSWEASININIYICIFVYFRLHSSTLVYIREDSSTIVYIHLVTRLHSSTFVYTRLVTRLYF